MCIRDRFNPVISCLSLTICFAFRKISFWHSESFKSFAHSFCFFFFAEEITLFAFCLLFLYSILVWLCKKKFVVAAMQLNATIIVATCIVFVAVIQRQLHLFTAYRQVQRRCVTVKLLQNCKKNLVLLPILMHYNFNILHFMSNGSLVTWLLHNYLFWLAVTPAYAGLACTIDVVVMSDC